MFDGMGKAIFSGIKMKKCDVCGRGLEYIGYFKIPKDYKYVKDLGIKIPFGVRNVKICINCVKKFNDGKD